jgi:hypothetical protein
VEEGSRQRGGRRHGHKGGYARAWWWARGLACEASDGQTGEEGTGLASISELRELLHGRQSLRDRVGFLKQSKEKNGVEAVVVGLLLHLTWTLQQTCFG